MIKEWWWMLIDDFKTIVWVISVVSAEFWSYTDMQRMNSNRWHTQLWRTFLGTAWSLARWFTTERWSWLCSGAPSSLASSDGSLTGLSSVEISGCFTPPAMRTIRPSNPGWSRVEVVATRRFWGTITNHHLECWDRDRSTYVYKIMYVHMYPSAYVNVDICIHTHSYLGACIHICLYLSASTRYVYLYIHICILYN